MNQEDLDKILETAKEVKNSNQPEQPGQGTEINTNQSEQPQEQAKQPDAVEPSKEQQLQEQYNDLDDRYKRLFAEFENYKKRTQKESLEKYNFITSDVVTKILPIMDNLQNAVNAKTEDTAYQDGVRMVLDQFNNCFRTLNVEEIIATPGTNFDPELHEAVQHIDDPEKGSNEIVQEFRKGYKIGNKVIRHSMVIVAN